MSAYSFMEVGMFIRRSFDEFSKLHTDAAPQDVRPDWVIDWR